MPLHRGHDLIKYGSPLDREESIAETAACYIAQGAVVLYCTHVCHVNICSQDPDAGAPPT